MHKKKLINLGLASLLPMSSVLMAEQAAVTQPTAAEPPAVTTTEPAAAPEVVTSESAEESAADTADYGRMSMEERWKEREQRYEELKKRAEEAGVMLPESPPWQEHKAMMPPHPEMQKRREQMEKLQAMTPEEREAFRMERYQEMRERAAEIGMELPETPPWKDRQSLREEQWAKHMEVIKGMTDEERAACHAMHRRHMRQKMRPGPIMRGRGMYPPAYEAPAPGYGYGPTPYGPRGNYWQPDQ